LSLKWDVLGAIITQAENNDALGLSALEYLVVLTCNSAILHPLLLEMANWFLDATGIIINSHPEAISIIGDIVVDTNKPPRSRLEAFKCLVNMANGQT
jgi:hypothetical protein